MPIPIQHVKDIIDLIFSTSGYNIKNFNVSFPQPLDIKIIKDKNNDIVLNFTGSMPKVGWQKLIRLTAWVQGITLGEKEGVLRLRYLPDIKFSYDGENKDVFGAFYDNSDIAEEISQKFGDCEEKKKIADKCLQYSSEWAKIASQSGTVFADCSERSRRELKRECKDFVVDNLRNDPEIVAGSVVLTFLFFYVVLPVILKFVLERLFKKLFD
jgi:hypothetical protein